MKDKHYQAIMGDHNLNAIIIMQSIVGHGTAFGVATSLMLLAPAQQQLHCVQYRIPYAEHRISYVGASLLTKVALNTHLPQVERAS